MNPCKTQTPNMDVDGKIIPLNDLIYLREELGIWIIDWTPTDNPDLIQIYYPRKGVTEEERQKLENQVYEREDTKHTLEDPEKTPLTTNFTFPIITTREHK